MNARQVICGLVAIAFAMVAVAAGGLAAFVVAWPATNHPEGKTGNWVVATPYIVVALAMLLGCALAVWLGFLRKK